MAFDIDQTTYEASAEPVDGLGKYFLMRRKVDFTVAANKLAQTKTMCLFKIPAYVLVEEVLMVVATADTDVTDVDIGSYTTAGVATVADGFCDGATLASTGIVRDLTGETYSPGGTEGYMAAADWCVGLLNNDADTINEAIVYFFARCIDLR